jgi:DNA-binding CsgD family transcriptional regulator
MATPERRLSPRQRDCLRLVFERQATSKEIAAELGISKTTVDGYIAEAVESLGARDRRDAARLLFAADPPAASGADPARVPDLEASPSSMSPSTDGAPGSRPWRSRHQPRNTMTLVQTIGWIAVIAVGSLLALTLATVIGNGLPAVAQPVLRAFDRLTP